GWGPDHPRPEPLVGFWFIATGVILVLGLGMTWATGTAGLSVPRMAIFAGVPLLVGLLSALLRAVLRDPGDWPWRWLPGGVRRLLVRALAWVPAHVRPPDGRVLTRDHLGPIWLVGDVMATLVIVVGGAGLVRSFTAVVVLDPGHVVAWLALATGVVAALGAWWGDRVGLPLAGPRRRPGAPRLARLVGRRAAPGPRQQPPAGGRGHGPPRGEHRRPAGGRVRARLGSREPRCHRLLRPGGHLSHRHGGHRDRAAAVRRLAAGVLAARAAPEHG